ncbi:MAG TPA: histidine kinase [Candidatus Alistipes stercoravium]|nr:histidine kinase [Candidatus Alistipes stercoravium]
MNSKRHILFCMLAVLAVLPPDEATAAAEPVAVTSEYAHRHYTTQDGLPQMLTEYIWQDAKGYIWIGTLSGFVRYDGFEFIPYLKGKQENILSFCPGSDGSLWALGFKRRHVVDREGAMRTLPLNERGLQLNNLNAYSLPPGLVLLENEQERGREICRLTAEGAETVLKASELDSMDICRRVYLDSVSQTFYIPTARHVCRIKADGTVLTPIRVAEPYSLLRDGTRLYLFAADGIHEVVGDHARPVAACRFLAPDYGVAACADRKGNIFIHDAHNLYRLSKDGSVRHIVDGINLIRQMCIDREGNLWLATYQGVYNYFQLNFVNHRLSDHNDILRAIDEDAQGRLLAGTLNGRLLRGQKAAGLRPIPYPHEEENYFLPRTARIGGTTYLLGMGDVLACDSGGRRWLGLPQRNYQFLGSHADSLLVATRQALYITDARGRIHRSYEGLRGVFCACPDGAGNLYAGTAYGVVRLRGEERREIVLPDSSISCTAMTVNPYGEILFASGENLYTVRDDSAVLVQSYGNPIRSVRQTSDNFLIVAVTDGLYITDNRLLQTMFFNQYNGFTGIEPQAAHIAETSDGTIWIPCVDQTVSFHPHELVYQYTTPRLELLSAQASTDNVHWQSVPADSDGCIRLKHRLRNLRFSYIAISHSATGNMRYRYRLEGFQGEWSQPQTGREVQFNNLPPGHYRLEVSALLGNISSDTIGVDILLLPAFWQHGWFWLAVALGLSSGIWTLAYTYYKRRNRQKMDELQREIKLNNLLVKSIRLKSIPHFNANVLAGIEYFIQTHSVTKANHYLSMYSRFTNSTLLDVDKPSRSIGDEIQYIRLYLSLEQLRYGESLSYRIHVATDVDPGTQVPNMILHTYCENAIKHGLRSKPGNGHIDIEVTTRLEGINIAVTDDGVGREAAAAFSSSSTKQGLNIMEQQIELYNQRNDKHIVQTVTDLRTPEGRACGTRFELYVPSHYNYF